MIYPKKINAGAVIGLVSPSSAISEERLHACYKVLKSMGFSVKLSDNICADKGGYMAGDERVRAAWINRMFADPEVDAIFCVRGGDGGNRVIPYLDLDVIRSNPKIFVGYSDITSFHLLFNQQCDLITFHGPMVSSNLVDHCDPETKLALFSCLNADDTYAYVPPAGFDIKTLRPGVAEGPITGGNLTVICTSIGTPYEVDTKGKILFLEDLDAHIGNLDRMVYQLKNAGLIDQAKGIIIGQFTDCRNDREDYDINQVVLDATEGLDIPVMSNIQSGHGFPMITSPMGATCRMDTYASNILFYTK